jgi:hypothetical protein
MSRRATASAVRCVPSGSWTDRANRAVPERECPVEHDLDSNRSRSTGGKRQCSRVIECLFHPRTTETAARRRRDSSSRYVHESRHHLAQAAGSTEHHGQRVDLGHRCAGYYQEPDRIRRWWDPLHATRTRRSLSRSSKRRQIDVRRDISRSRDGRRTVAGERDPAAPCRMSTERDSQSQDRRRRQAPRREIGGRHRLGQGASRDARPRVRGNGRARDYCVVDVRTRMPRR